MSERIAAYPRRTVELYHLDFHDRSIRPKIVLGANERVVSVELGHSLPLRVWIESTFQTPKTIADKGGTE